MKKIALLTICFVSIAANASFNLRVPLEVKNNGTLPDGSILFKDKSDTSPINPTEPEEPQSNCLIDVSVGTYYMIERAAGESLVYRYFNGSRILNGSQGKLVDKSEEQYGIPLYELCMNGEDPQAYIEPVETWMNGECKYNTLGEAPQRYWTEVNNGNYQGEKAFQNAAVGASGFVNYGNTNINFLNFGTLYNYGIKVNSNSQIIYNGYKYYKGKYIYSIENGYSYSDNYSGISFTSPIDYYEICRTQ